MHPIGLTRRAWLGLGLGLSLPAARAQSWPDRPIQLLAPAGPGSVPDVRARWLAARLGLTLGQPVVVENRPGAGGNLAMEAAARQPPDGHTWVIVHAGHLVLNPLLYARLGYDPQDFRLVTRVGAGPLLLLVSPGSRFKSVAALLSAGADAPGKLSHASQGVGTPPHLAAELFMQLTGLRSLHVPYANPAQPIADLVGGRVDWMLEGTPAALPMARAGKVRALAVMAPTRLAQLAEVPSIAEAGWPDAGVEAWTGLALRRDTPAPVFERTASEVRRVLTDDEAVRWFGEVGNVPGAESPQDSATLLEVERRRWVRVVDAAGLRAIR